MIDLKAQAHAESKAWAKAMLEREDWVILDTETTGLSGDAEAIQLGLIDHKGDSLISTLMSPKVSVSEGARAVHGIQDSMLIDAPSFAAIRDSIQEKIEDKTVLIYNAPFDCRILKQCAIAHSAQPLAFNSECVMLRYSAWVGEPGKYGKGFKWQKLQGGDHSALG
jgi:DNA polymerase III subunit epsilon